MTYSIRIDISASGTPLLSGGESSVGHMYYELINNTTGEITSYGFAPIEHGSPFTEGQVYHNDNVQPA